MLPWQGAEDVERLSPVEVSGRYLRHVREAWDAAFAESPLAEQDLVLTLPASFDEVARELTVKAAAQAGLPRVVLIEEPQAAFYAWIYTHTDRWETQVEPGQKILVCDCGGGTSDFTLIRVRRGKGDKIQFHRVAVGNHLILGGDNLDLALARHLEQRLTDGGQLEPRGWAVLVRSCRQVKETLLADDARPSGMTVNLPGLRREADRRRPANRGNPERGPRAALGRIFSKGWVWTRSRKSRTSGFQEFGLPYASDPAITRYLATFLRAHRNVAIDEAEGPARA